VCEDRITPLLEEVLACVVATFDDCGGDPFCRTGVVAGQVAWDDCCTCGDGDGQLWARMSEWAPDPEFTQPGPTGCLQPSLLVVEVGALRCIPVLDSQGKAPSAAEEAAAAARTYLDAQLISKGVLCCVPARTWLGWSPLGYEGGCGGGAHQFEIPFTPCSCADAESP
jgi:hypothetical protein